MEGIDNQFIDIRKYLKTDQNYRNANIDLELSGQLCREAFDFNTGSRIRNPRFHRRNPHQPNHHSGTRGIGYTAALLANLLNAEDVTIWKDSTRRVNAGPERIRQSTSDQPNVIQGSHRAIPFRGEGYSPENDKTDPEQTDSSLREIILTSGNPREP